MERKILELRTFLLLLLWIQPNTRALQLKDFQISKLQADEVTIDNDIEPILFYQSESTKEST